MDLIDDSGNLLGRINIIDACVLLFVVSIVIAGATAAISPILDETSDDTQAGTQTKHAAIDIGEVPQETIEKIVQSESFSKNGVSLEVDDIYIGPSSEDLDSKRRVVVGINAPKQNTNANDSMVMIDGVSYENGDEISMTGKSISPAGTVVGISSNHSIDTVAYPVQLEATVAPSVADSIEPGDEYRMSNDTIAKIETVSSVSDGSNGRVIMGATLRSINRSGTPFFGSIPVKIGSEIPIRTEDYAIDATVLYKGAFGPGTQTAQPATIRIANVSAVTAKAIEVGATTDTGNAGAITINDKRVEPASVITSGSSGVLGERKDVYLTADLQVRKTDKEIYFRGKKLTLGSPVVVELPHVIQTGKVTNITVTDS